MSKSFVRINFKIYKIYCNFMYIYYIYIKKEIFINKCIIIIKLKAFYEMLFSSSCFISKSFISNCT